MYESVLIASTMRALTIAAGTAVLAIPAVAAQDEAGLLGAAIHSAVLQAQADSAAQTLSAEQTKAAIVTAIQQVVAVSGASPATATASIASARHALASNGNLSPAASGAIDVILAQIVNAANAVNAPAASSSATHGPSLGPPPVAGSGGSGGSDYRPSRN